MKAISLLILLAACSHRQPDDTLAGSLSRQLQQCYHESDSIFMKPPVEGKIVYEITTSPEGKISEAKILESDFTKDRNFEACITGQVKRYKYPKSPENKEMKHIQPLNFTAAIR